MRLNDVISKNLSVELTVADNDLVKEIQGLLHRSEYPDLIVDGIVGAKTLLAVEDFKRRRWLQYPTIIGVSTARNLLEINAGHNATAEHTELNYAPDVQQVGSRTGKTIRLPNGDTVYENQPILSPIKLTWGEMTNGCDPRRVPVSNEIVNNIIKFTRTFGWIRDKFALPIFLNSGYRPQNVNRAVGGARFSQHIYGLAGDLNPSDHNFTKLLQVVKASNCTGVGLGMHRGFIHVDCRPGGRVVFNY